MKKVYIFILIFIFLISGCVKKEASEKISVVSTIFPGYDFARAVGGDNIDLKMLIKPGTESHSYDPTPKDITIIQESDIFIYVGGESEEWINDILKDISEKTKIIRLMDLVEVKEEEFKEGMEHDHDEDDSHTHEYDEHIWTSPINAIKIVNNIKDKLIDIDNINKEIYEKNALEYIDKLNELDTEIKSIVENSNKKELVFADRFPFRYFVDEYNLDYRAAFNGCSSATEASSKTIAYLINYIKDSNIPVVFYLELSNQNIANTLVEATNAKKLEFHSAHNLTKDEFESGITYVDIMKKNIKNLKEALK